MLIDEAWCDLFARPDVTVGVSIDGVRVFNDAYRGLPGGYEAAARAKQEAQAARLAAKQSKQDALAAKQAAQRAEQEKAQAQQKVAALQAKLATTGAQLVLRQGAAADGHRPRQGGCRIRPRRNRLRHRRRAAGSPCETVTLPAGYVAPAA